MLRGDQFSANSILTYCTVL